MFHNSFLSLTKQLLANGGNLMATNALRLALNTRSGQSRILNNTIIGCMHRYFQQQHRMFSSCLKTLAPAPSTSTVRTEKNTVDSCTSQKLNHDDVIRKIQRESVKNTADKKVFAVVHIAGKQFKIAPNDVIMINKKIEADCGELIRLEKVLAAGSRTYTLLGQPLLKRDLVNIEAVVMEKTKGEKKIVFKKKRRKGYKRWQGHRQDLSVLKIKSISLDTSVL